MNITSLEGKMLNDGHTYRAERVKDGYIIQEIRWKITTPFWFKAFTIKTDRDWHQEELEAEIELYILDLDGEFDDKFGGYDL